MRTLFAHVLFLVAALAGVAGAEGPAAGGAPSGGLAVTVGPTDGTREADLLGRGRFLVVHVTADAAAAAQLRDRFAAQGLAGAITVVEAVQPGTLPFIDDLVALAVVDGPHPPADAEILRVLRPQGVARISGPGGTRELVKPRPPEYADWGQYQRDAAMNPVTPDRAVGIPSGFQWVSDSDPDKGPLDVISVRILDGICVNFERGYKSPLIVARDAYSGLELWRAALNPKWQSAPFQQYGFLAAEGRVYVHLARDPHAVSLDLRTGAQLTVYDQGATFPPAKDEYEIGLHTRMRRDLVHRGMLLQVYGSTIHALDFATGRPLWKNTHPQDLNWLQPAAEGDVLVVAEGTTKNLQGILKLSGYLRSWSGEIGALVGISLTDGRQLWRTPLAQPMYPLDNCIRDGRYAIAMVKNLRGKDIHPENDKALPSLCVDIRDGAIVWQQDLKWPGGHPPYLMATSEAFWLTSHFGGVGVPRDGGATIDRADAKDKDLGLWGCNTTWMNERLMFSRLTVTEIATGRYRYNTAVRSACVFGTTPANGLLYSTPHGCGCHGTTGGYNAVHSRDMSALRTPWTGRRLIAGTGKPSPAPAAAADDEWPVYLRDSARSNWNATRLPKDIALAWTVPAPATRAPDWLIDIWKAAQQQRPGGVTALTAAEGVVAGAYPNQHAVFTLDPASGQVRWIRQLDSLIDSPPTIHRGVLYVGTRGGWLWALSRDTGEVIWRFLAAPHQRLTVVNGALESLWPLYGTVAVHDGRLWISAGRSAELDNGITWYSLDPATGAVRSTGRIADDSEWFEKGRSLTDDLRVKGINSPLIINGDFAMLAPMAFRPSDGSVLQGGKDYAVQQYDAPNLAKNPVPVPGRSGLVYRGRDGAGRTGPFMFYGGIGGRLIAYRGDDFVVTQGGKPGARGGGAGFIGRWKRLPPQPGKKLDWKTFADQSEQVWQSKPLIGEHQVATGLAVAGDTVVSVVPVKNGSPVMVRYHYQDGSALGETPLPSWPVLGGIAVAKGTVFVAASDGSVSAYR